MIILISYTLSQPKWIEAPAVRNHVGYLNLHNILHMIDRLKLAVLTIYVLNKLIRKIQISYGHEKNFLSNTKKF